MTAWPTGSAYWNRIWIYSSAGISWYAPSSRWRVCRLPNHWILLWLGLVIMHPIPVNRYTVEKRQTFLLPPTQKLMWYCNTRSSLFCFVRFKKSKHGWTILKWQHTKFHDISAEKKDKIKKKRIHCIQKPFVMGYIYNFFQSTPCEPTCGYYYIIYTRK